MADFAAARSTHSADFTDGIWWEVIVMHEATGGLTGKVIDDLLIA